MNAVRIHRYGGPDALVYERDVPDPVPSAEMVLVQSVATSVNPIDWKVRSGARQKDFPLTFPAILGRDVSGVVRAVGSGVRNFKPGDRVFGMSDATYAELVLVPEAVLSHLPEGLDPVDAAAIPLICLTGDQLVRFATRAEMGQTILVTGALGSVGRAAVHVAKNLGAKVIAGVRGRQLREAEQLGVSSVVAIDDDAAISKLGLLDGIADTVGGETAAKLIGKIRKHGMFGYASALPVGTASTNPTVEVIRVFAKPDACTVREFAADVRVGAFVLPISHRMQLREAAAAHRIAEKGGGGKIVLLM